MKRIIKNTELAKWVCEAIPEADFEKVLNTIDIGRNEVEENTEADEEIIEITIYNFKQAYE